MTKVFFDKRDIATHIMWAVHDSLRNEGIAAEIGISGKSVSCYVTATLFDENEDLVCKNRLRISDHPAPASAGGDIVAEIDLDRLFLAEVWSEVEDEEVDGEIFQCDPGLEGYEVTNAWEMDRMIENAVNTLKREGAR